jgi:hypothetical protein
MSKGGGGSSRQITSSSGATPFAKPFIEYGMTEAQKLYESAAPQYYPESTVVGFSPETEMALTGIRQQAVTGSPFIPAAQNVVMQNLMGTNPLQSAAMRPVLEATQANLAQAGRYGSGYGQAAIAQALAPMAYQAQQAAIQQAPMAREFGMADLQTLAQVGAAREALSQAELEADIQRFQFEQDRPAQKLADYMTFVTGGSGALGGQQIQPVYRDKATGFLSGALGGARTAQMAGVNPMYGAIGGALLGGFG